MTSAADFLFIEHLVEHFEYINLRRNRQNKNDNNNIDRQLSNNYHKNIRVTDNNYNRSRDECNGTMRTKADIRQQKNRTA